MSGLRNQRSRSQRPCGSWCVSFIFGLVVEEANIALSNLRRNEIIFLGHSESLYTFNQCLYENMGHGIFGPHKRSSYSFHITSVRFQ
jgi:hypothetical protein